MWALGTTWLECATELLRIWILNDGRFLLRLCFPMAIRYCWYIIHPRKKQLSLSLQLSILFIDAYSTFKWGNLDICRNLAAAAQGSPWIIYFSQKQDKLYSAKHHVAMSVQIVLLRLSHFKIAQILIPHCSLWVSYSAWTTFLVESNLNARNREFWVTVKKTTAEGLLAMSRCWRKLVWFYRRQLFPFWWASTWSSYSVCERHNAKQNSRSSSFLRQMFG